MKKLHPPSTTNIPIDTINAAFLAKLLLEKYKSVSGVMRGNVEHIKTWNALLKGEQAALEDLYNQHYIGLLNYGVKFIRDREVAKDCIFQLLLKLWDTRDRLTPLSNVRSYLITCVHNELLLYIKRNNKVAPDIRNAYLDTESSHEEYLVEMQHNQELKDKLMAAFYKLSEREKQLLLLKFFEDRSYDEISTTCGISKRTAYNTIHGALKILKQSLTEELKVTVNSNFILTALRTIVF